MPFTLRVSFSGLCLFVQDATTGFTHVLLLAPDRGPMRSGDPMPMAMPRHFPRMFYQPQLDGAPINGKAAYRCVSIDDKILDFSSIAGTPNGLLDLPADLISLTNFVQPLPNAWIGQSPDEQVAARVILPPSGTMTAGDGPICQLGGWTGKASTQVTWNSGPIVNDSLTWQLEGLRLDTGSPLLPLSLGCEKHPRDSDENIEICIKNVLHECSVGGSVPGKPLKPGTAVPHFRAYYGPFNTNGPDLIIDSARPSKGGDKATSDSYTCMSAQAPLEPSPSKSVNGAR
jgi:hypothetical protein